MAVSTQRADPPRVAHRTPRTPGGVGLRKRGAGVRHDLEGLRALAVLGVVIYHLRPRWLPGGFAGVDVFFVLSGYFITGLLLREIERTGTVDLLGFWGRRARRLLPASALVLVATVLGGVLLTNPLEAQRVARDALFTAVFAMNWHAAAQGTDYFTDPDPSPLVHFWSLGVEEQFYLLWPLLLLALALVGRAGRRWTPRRTLTVLAAVSVAASFLLALGQTVGANSYAYFGTAERAWQLALGGLLAAVASQLGRLPAALRVVARWLGVALVLGFYVAASYPIVYPGRKALVPALGAALIIAAGEPLRRRDPLARLLCSTPAQLGGRYSYGWYLWHYPPLVLLPIYLDRPLRIRELGLCAAGTLLAAALTYHLLEDPVRASRWLAARRGGRSLLLGVLLVGLGLGSAQLARTLSEHRAGSTSIADRYGHPLVPQPAAAAAQLPRVYADGCVIGTGSDALVPAARLCRYLPDTGRGDVILVGDSHAATWFPAVYDVAKRHGWGLRFWARNSCPLADVTKQLGSRPYRACDRWRADLLHRLVAARPSLVVTANFDSQLSTLYLRDAGGAAPARPVHGPAARRVWADGLLHSLQVLRSAGIPVLVIHDNPGYPATMPGPDCVLAHPHELSACSLPQRQALPPGPSDLTAARRAGMPVLDNTGAFCHGGRCYQVVGRTLAYRDHNHLTAEMVRALEPRLAAAMTRALRVG